MKTFLAAAVILAAGTLPGCGRSAQKPQLAKETSMSSVQHFTETTFAAAKAQEKPVLVDFWASWCGPCRTQGPILDQVAAQIGDQAVVGKVNVDEERGLAAAYGVQSIPTLVILKDGKEVQRFVGVQSAEALLSALKAR